MKVGVLSLPYEPNYGWAVQLWALYHSIEKLGHQPVVINRRWNITKSSPIISIQRFLYYNTICARFSRFIKKEIPHMTPIIRTSSTMADYSEGFDAVIVGSDQVWRIENTRGADLNFFLDFIKTPSIKRISYAASFGKDTWQGTALETEKVRILLAEFNKITVREDSGVLLCKNLFGVEATNVLDPTMLLAATDYNTILSTPKCKNQITTYILDSTEEKTSTIQALSDKYNSSVVSLFPKKRITYYRSVYNWLENIRDAKYVVVDSFHGMVLSIIFRKNFVVLANSKRGLTRFTSLLLQLGLEDRLIHDFDFARVDSILAKSIDYNKVETKLNNMREFSLSILQNSLS